MEAVIDPSGPTIVGYVPPNASRHGGPWADFVTIPAPDGINDKPLKVSLVDGEYVLSIDDVTMSAQAWTALRSERNRRLAACDWTQLADAHMSQDKKDAWATYRQELRDLPDSITDPTGPSVSWPLDPTQTPPTPATGSRLESLMSVAV